MAAYLKDKSIEVVLHNQHTSGAYIASPSFDTYKYCWLRDGSFVAYSMDITGHAESAGRFFDWVDRVVSGQSEKVKKIIETANDRQPLLNSDFLPTRYTLEGLETNDEWPNFQLDGYGTWLWALHEHIQSTGNTGLTAKYAKSINTSVDYLLRFWDTPNYDCWEENGDKVHPSTLACIYGGLNSINTWLKYDSIKTVLSEIKSYISSNCIKNGRLTKYAGSESIDASLLWLSLPFGVFDVKDEVMQKTVSKIEESLFHQGVHRYPEDTYYGGGEWILLSCWLGWYYVKTGLLDKARRILCWVEKQANEKGELPEQVLKHVNKPGYISKWKELWGEPANPLLWSHAMYLVLLNSLDEYVLSALYGFNGKGR